VDAVLLSHPDIGQAVAFGVPDDKYSEEVIKKMIICM
jgi:acyl-CoA synthetase (AMP-forming)/AMP-acid ligase II